MNAHDIDYVVKTDTDTMPILEKYFAIADINLPPAPAPYNETRSRVQA